MTLYLYILDVWRPMNIIMRDIWGHQI